MAVQIETLEKLERRITLTVPAQEINAEVESRLKKLSRTVCADGFRPGKVPLSVVAQRYGASVQYEVMNDKIAARILARLHAAGLLPAVWVPPQAVRELRALVAQRQKMRELGGKAKTRLHNVLHRHHLRAPKGHVFAAKNRSFWENLPVSSVEKAVALSDLEALERARSELGPRLPLVVVPRLHGDVGDAERLVELLPWLVGAN